MKTQFKLPVIIAFLIVITCTSFKLTAQNYINNNNSTVERALDAEQHNYKENLTNIVIHKDNKEKYTNKPLLYKKDGFLILTDTASPTEINKLSNWKTLKSEMELYTEFHKEQGCWNDSGELIDLNTSSHSQLLPIRSNTNYYVGYKEDSKNIRATFFDKKGMFLCSLLTKDMAEYDYKKPDATGIFKNYVKLYTFKSPKNAKYISLNLSDNPSLNYREYISSKPVFALTGTGNYIVPTNNKTYQRTKNRKLCIIGTSQIMTDRLYRTGNFNEYGENTSQYIIGIPEYLLPWWGTCDSYGYSNASMMPIKGAKNPSIYERVVINQLDLSEYDDYIITHAGPGINANNIGALSDNTDLGDNATYIGALRQIVNYIYTQNPNANIFVQTRINRSHLSNPVKLATIKQVNQRIREMCRMLNLTCIDCERDSGFNQTTAAKWCYDKLGHYNQTGNKMMGLFIRKAMLHF